MIKFLTTLLFLIFIIGCKDSFILKKQNFPNTSFTKVILYQSNTSNNITSSIEEVGGKILTENQVKILLNIFNDPRYFDDRLGLRCFKPDLQLIFYEQENLPVSNIEVSFECNQISSFPKLDYQSFSVEGYNRIKDGLLIE